MKRRYTKCVSGLVKNENGSASLEFIILAIPLFIPLALYLSSANGNSQELQTLNNAARQSARAFVTSSTEELAPVRAEEVLSVFQGQSPPGERGGAMMQISISCESTPCLTPNSKVTVKVTDPNSGRFAEATQIVDSWRSSA